MQAVEKYSNYASAIFLYLCLNFSVYNDDLCIFYIKYPIDTGPRLGYNKGNTS